jgi:glutamate synthase (NADPH/NADH) large chain
MVDLLPLEATEDLAEVREMIERHVRFTKSDLGQEILDHWTEWAGKFVKVFPSDFRRMQASLDRVHASGVEGEDAVLQAFFENRDETEKAGVS